MHKKKAPNYQEVDLSKLTLAEFCHGGASLQEIADFMGLSKERVRQIETTALYKMRRYILKRRLKEPDFCKVIFDDDGKLRGFDA